MTQVIPTYSCGGVLHTNCFDDFINFYNFQSEFAVQVIEAEEFYGPSKISEKVALKELNHFANMNISVSGVEFSPLSITDYKIQVSKVKTQHFESEVKQPECKLTKLKVEFNCDKPREIENIVRTHLAHTKTMTIRELLGYINFSKGNIDDHIVDGNSGMFFSLLEYCRPKCKGLV